MTVRLLLLTGLPGLENFAHPTAPHYKRTSKPFEIYRDDYALLNDAKMGPNCTHLDYFHINFSVEFARNNENIADTTGHTVVKIIKH